MWVNQGKGGYVYMHVSVCGWWGAGVSIFIIYKYS